MRNSVDVLVVESQEFDTRGGSEKWLKQIRDAADTLWPPPKKSKKIRCSPLQEPFVQK